MPQAKAKKPRKPVKYMTYGYKEYDVKDCMYWPDPSAKVQAMPTGASTHKLIPQKGEVGKSLDRGFDLSGLQSELPRNPADDDHAIDALRGWPHREGEKEGGSGGEEEGLYEKTALEVEAEQRKDKKNAGKKTKKGGSKKSRRSGGLEGGDGPDPYMCDLMAHRFMLEAARARQEQREQERRAEIQRRKIEYEKKFPKDIKATKASQLRSIAQAEKAGLDGRELWQMSRFKNVSPHLDTFRGSSKTNEPAQYQYTDEGLQQQPSHRESAGRYKSHDTDREPELNFTSDVYEYGTFDGKLGGPLYTQPQEPIAL